MAFREACPQIVLEMFKAAYRFEPFGDDWDQAGTLASAVLAPHSKRPPQPKDFIPNFKKPKLQTVDEMWEELTAGMGVA